MSAKLPALVLMLFAGLIAGSKSSPIALAETSTDACHTGLTAGDTARFVGFTRNHRRAGEMRIWTDSANLLRYSESWRSESSDYVWDGEIETSADATPLRVVWRARVDGTPRSTQTIERVGDSVIVTRGAQRIAERLPSGAFRVPSFRPGAVVAVLAQCALARSQDGLQTSRFGVLRAGRATTIRLRAGTRARIVSLYAVTSDSVPDVDRIWLDERGRLFAYPELEGVMYALPLEWASSVDQLIAAEVRAAEPRMRESAKVLSKKPADGIVFAHARVLDVRRGTSSENMSVFVRGSRIIAVGPDVTFVAPRGAMIVDATGKTLMPGLFDMGQAGINDSWGAESDQRTRSLLSQGLTSIQEMGGDTLFSPRIIRRIANHAQIGPRMFADCSIQGRVPDTIGGAFPRYREQHGQVGDAAELQSLLGGCKRAGLMSLNINMTFAPHLVSAAVREAHSRGMRVTGEALRNETARDLILAGYDGFTHVGQTLFPFVSIDSSRDDWLLGRVGGMASFWYSGEKLSQLDLNTPKIQEVVRLLVQRRLPMVTTLCVYPPINRYTRMHDSTWDAASFAKLREYVAVLHRAGAALTVGTDGACTVARELELLHEIGFTNSELLNMATLGAAKALRWDRDLGTVEVGKLADMILVDGDPLTKLSDLERVTAVMQDGFLYTDLAALRAQLPFLSRGGPPTRPNRSKSAPFLKQ